MDGLLKVGIAAGLAASAASVPMVFHLPTVGWFNTMCVTADVPEERVLMGFYSLMVTGMSGIVIVTWSHRPLQGDPKSGIRPYANVKFML